MAALQTYAVNWVKDLPVQPSDEESIVLVIVTHRGERVPIRYTVYGHLKTLRQTNNISPNISDVQFLTDGGLQDLIAKGAGTHFELGIGSMTASNPKGQRVEFKGNPFEAGTNKATK